MGKYLTSDQIRNKLVHRPDVILLDEYKGAKRTEDRNRWKCVKCEKEWSASWISVINHNSKCPYCLKEKMLDRRLSRSDVEERLSKRPDVILLEEYIYCTNKYEWKCVECGNIWTSKWNTVINLDTGCPICSLKNRSGENHPFWRGGQKNDYSQEWTERLRESIRNRDQHKCRYPDCDYNDTKEKRKLDVHHIDSNKQNCEQWNLISLCVKHHRSVENNIINNRKEYWEDIFYEILSDYQ